MGLTRAFVAARDELSALSFPPSRAVSALGRCGLPLCSFVLRSLPHGAASPPFYRQTEVERHRRERGRVERPRRGSGHPSAVRPVGQTSSSETRSSSQCALITRQHWCQRRPRGSADRLLFLRGPQAQRLPRSFRVLRPSPGGPSLVSPSSGRSGSSIFGTGNLSRILIVTAMVGGSLHTRCHHVPLL